MKVENHVNLSKYTTEDKRAFVKGLLESANANFITIEFTKKDGTNRSMNIQQAALQNHIKGDEASDSAKKAVETRKKNHPELLAVYDVQKHEIRSVNLDTVSIVRSQGKTYNFKD